MNDHVIGTIVPFDRGIGDLTVLDHRRLCRGFAAVAVALVVPKVVPNDHLVVMVLHRDDRAWN
jgi:hypothetical protein